MTLLKSLVLLGIATVGLHAAPFSVTLDTSGLSGDYQIYMALTGATGNSATAFLFDLGGGVPGDVILGTGDVSSIVTLDTSTNPFLDEFAQNFTVGSVLSFVLDLTNNGPASPNAPDSFAFALASTGGVNLETNDPQGGDYLFYVDLTGGPLNFQIFSTTSTTFPSITPVIAPTTVIPEPATGMVIAGALLGILGIRRARQRK